MSPDLRRALGGLAGAAAMIAAVTVLSRILGLGRWLAQAAAVGAGPIGDAYNSANTLPNVLFEVAAGGALSGALIPVLAGPVARGERKDVDRIASATLGWTLLVLIPLGVLLAVASGPIASLLGTVGGQDSPEQQALVQYFLLVFAVQVPMYGLAVLLYGILQAHKRFFWPAFAPVMASVVTITAYLVYGRLADGELADPTALPPDALPWLAWGTTLGVAAMCFPLLVPVRRIGVHLSLTLRFPPGAARRVRSLAFAGVGGLLAQQAAVVVALLVARSRGSDGTYTVFLWAQVVYLLPYAVLVVPLATSTFPRLAARAASHDHAGFARMASGTVRAVLAAAAVGAAALGAAAPAVADVFAVIGDGDPAVLAAMGTTLTAMVPGLLGFSVMFHASRALYALERGRSAVVATATGWATVAVASVVLGIVLVPDGRDGPATLLALGLASSIGMLVGGGVALVALRRAAGHGALTGLTRSAVVLVLGAAIGVVLGRGVTDAVGVVAGHSLWTAVGAGAGGAVLASVVVVGVLLVADRGTMRDLLQIEREPVPADAAWQDSPSPDGGDVRPVG